MATIVQTKPVKIEFQNKKDRDEFIDWAENGQKDNSSEMIQMRNKLDEIRQRRKAMVNPNAKRRNK